jgi:hypothetical protein
LRLFLVVRQQQLQHLGLVVLLLSQELMLTVEQHLMLQVHCLCSQCCCCWEGVVLAAVLPSSTAVVLLGLPM